MTNPIIRTIGTAIYGPSYDEAHEQPRIFDHLVAEQDRVSQRVFDALMKAGRLILDGDDSDIGFDIGAYLEEE